MATMKLNGAGTYAAFGSADLTGKRHYLAKVGTDGLIALAGSGETVLGTVFEEGSTTYPVTVQINGNGKVICGATVTAGDKLQATTGGKAITSAGGDVFGVALNSGLVNEIIEFTFDK